MICQLIYFYTPFATADRHLHCDFLQDVQLYAVRCFCHVLRVYAPDTPYDNGILLQLFEGFLVALRRLEDAKDPMFGVCRSVLDTLVQVDLFPVQRKDA